MARLNDDTRYLWQWMFQEGGRYTAHEIAKRMQWHTDYAMERIYSMFRNELVEKFPPAAGSRRQRYGITGTCAVPTGMRIAEVQA